MRLLGADQGEHQPKLWAKGASVGWVSEGHGSTHQPALSPFQGTVAFGPRSQ